MACVYKFKGKTYDKDDFTRVLLNMSPSEASKFMPDVSSIPEAPFTKSTPAWSMLAMKRIIRYASENGFDKVAWTSGQQQFDRYPDGTAADTEKRLEGMQSFYDKMLPSNVNKFIKKFGGRVEPIEIDSNKQLSFEITPDLRRSAMGKGMPLFAKAPKKPKPKTSEAYDKLIKTLRNAASSIVEKQKALEFYAKTLPEPVRIKAMMHFKRIADSKRIPTQEKKLDAAMDRLAIEMNKYNGKLHVTAIEKMVKPLKKQNSVAKGSRGADVEAFLAKGKEILDMKGDKKKGITADEQLLEYVDKITSQDNPDAVDEAAILMFAGLRNKSTSEKKQIRVQLLAMISEGRTSWKKIKEDWKLYIDPIRVTLLAEISGEADFQIDTGVSKRARDEKAKKYLNSQRNRMDKYSNSIQSFVSLLDKITKKSGSKSFAGATTEHLYDLVYDAQRAQDKMQDDLLTQAEDQMKKIFKTKKIYKVSARNAKVIKANKTGVKLSDGTPLALSQSEAGDLWLSWQDTTLTERLMEIGKIDSTTMDQVEAFMTPRVKQWAKWQLDNFYSENWERVNPIFSKHNGVNLGHNPKYHPIESRHPGGSESKEVELSKPPKSHVSMIKGSMKSRIPNKREIMIRNMDEVLLNHISETAHFVAWAEPVKELRSLFGNEKVIEAIKIHVPGDNALKVVNGFIDDFASLHSEQRGDMPILNMIRRNFTLSAIAMNPLVYIKQLTSIPAFIPSIPAGEYAKGQAKFWLNPWTAARTIMNTDYMKFRYLNGHSRDMRQALNKSQLELGNKIKWQDRSMFLTKLGDGMAIVIGGYPVYNYHYKKAIKDGKSIEDAKVYADRKFGQVSDLMQQASAKSAQSEYERGNTFQKLTTQFMQSPMMYLRVVQAAKRNWKHGKADSINRLFVAGVLLPALFSAIGNALLLGSGDDDKIEEGLKSVLLDTATGLFNGYPLIRDFVEMIKNNITQKPYGREMEITPFVSNFSTLGKAFKEGFKDEADMVKALDYFIDGIMQLLGMPVRQFKKISSIYEDMQDGEDINKARFLGYTKYQTGEK